MGGGSTTRTEPWAEQKPYLQTGFKEAERLAKAGPPSFYPGQTLAGFTPAQQMAQRATMGYATGPRPAAQQAAAEKAMIGGLGGQVDYSQFQPMADVYGQQYLSEISKNMPAVRQQMVQYQPGGGSRGDIAQANIASAAGKNLAQNLAGLYGGAYSAAQERIPQFTQQYPTIMGAPMGMYGAMGDVGAQQRALQQEQLNQQQQAYEYTAQAPMTNLQQYMANISGDYGGTSKSTPSTLSSLGQIIGIMGSISDVRAKENITPVGKYKGMNVYDFNYKWSPERHRGLMAQEVEQVKPEAVGDINGLKYIDYGKV